MSRRQHHLQIKLQPMKSRETQESTATRTPPSNPNPDTLTPQPSDVSRRKFLTGIPKIMAGTAVGAGVLGVAPGTSSIARAQSAPQLPWPYQVLDPDAVAERAYAAFYVKGCMYGAFEGIIGELRAVIGSPYTEFPSLMMEYGKGGINGIWGTLCGTLNGAAAAINLVSSKPAPIIDEVYFWYSQSMLPDYRPQNPRFEVPQSVSGSPICHASVQRWCESSGFSPQSPQRADRCGWLTACTARYTVQQLNAQALGTFAATHTRPDEVQRCVTCHGTGYQENVHHGANMTCVQCHSQIDDVHPLPHISLRWTPSRSGKTLESADSVLGPWITAPEQGNPQPLLNTDPAKFFRLK